MTRVSCCPGRTKSGGGQAEFYASTDVKNLQFPSCVSDFHFACVCFDDVAITLPSGSKTTAIIPRYVGTESSRVVPSAPPLLKMTWFAIVVNTPVRRKLSCCSLHSSTDGVCGGCSIPSIDSLGEHSLETDAEVTILIPAQILIDKQSIHVLSSDPSLQADL